jgi:RNA polymerase sigma factor (sigma-70 family)
VRSLQEFIADESDMLRKILRSYVIRLGRMRHTTPDAAAAELLNEVVVEALHHVDRFDTTRQPKAWLLGIAANLLRRQQSEVNQRERREPLMRDLIEDEAASDDELFDQLAGISASSSDPAYISEANEALVGLLGSVSMEDQQILRLAVLHEMNGDEVAQALGITSGAARVRLHRAIRRLRAAVEKQRAEEQAYDDIS